VYEPGFGSVMCPGLSSRYNVEGSSRVDDNAYERDGDSSQRERTTVFINATLSKARIQCLSVHPFQFGMHTLNVA